MTDRYRYRVYIPNIGYVYPYDERERALNVDIDNLHCDEVFASYEEIISDTNDNIKYLIQEGKIVEQCTGLRDKQGYLIYEGDIVYCFNHRNEYAVEWDQWYCCFNLVRKIQGGKEIKPLTAYLELLIRGNVNDQKRKIND